MPENKKTDTRSILVLKNSLPLAPEKDKVYLDYAQIDSLCRRAGELFRELQSLRDAAKN